ncbi:MAG: GAF domain-containing sensor histidine kinase [Anaerolineaceae bacterium]|nr:GAF domain-containing sensor histidine kinase [Anaerolineaceae bacterium]
MSLLTREQLEKRLAALHSVSLELIQEISLESVLRRIAELAKEQVNARYAAVGVLGEDGALEQFIPIGIPQEQASKMSHPPLGLGLIGATMQSTKPIRLPDIALDPRSAGFPEHHPGMTTFLGVSIYSGDERYGQIYLTDKEGGVEFSEDDEQIIETLAAYASVAIANARLYKKLIRREQSLTRRNENLARLNDLASTLASSPSINQILEKTLSQVMDYFSLDVGEIYVMQEGNQKLARALHQGTLASSIWKNDLYWLDECILGKVATTEEVKIINLPDEDQDELSDEMLETNIHQIGIFPLVGRQGVLGVMSIASRHVYPLNESEIQFLSAISFWAGTAIENVRLSVQQRRIAILEERERIGMDLHDGVIQSIYAVGLVLEHARLLMSDDKDQATDRIGQAIDQLNTTIRDIRAYILDLRPRKFNDENLLQGIHRLVNEFRANTLVDVHLNGPDDGLVQLSPVLAGALFHICQEALANVAKHAQARNVSVTIWAEPGQALLEVKDDGKGFDPVKVQQSIGHGLSNMLTRVQNVGGGLMIESLPDGENTIVRAWVPYKLTR